MKTNRSFQTTWLVTWLAWALLPTHCLGELGLNLRADGPRVNLSWPATLEIPLQGTLLPAYTVERSADLIHWEPVATNVRGVGGSAGPLLRLSLDQRPGPTFYRVLAATGPASSQDGDNAMGEVFGYGSRLAEELDRAGLMSVETFASKALAPAYLPQITWDPTSAAYWTNFNTNAAFRPNPAELALFLTNGFVVSERLGSPSFADAYYRVFTNDLPVFVTTDSILQAWHRTYLNMLEELEELPLATSLDRFLSGMAGQLPATWQRYGSGPLRESILDADFFLAVALSLWYDQQWPSALGVAGQDQRVAAALAAVKSLSLQRINLFGSERWVDFSQFTVRGHYNNSRTLRCYFKTMMWCGQIDFRLATFYPNQEDDIRQLGAVVVMRNLLRTSWEFGSWLGIDQLTSALTGISDSMTFRQLWDLLDAAKIYWPSNVSNLATLTNLQTRLLTGDLGLQMIPGNDFYSPLSREQVRLPRSFAVCGRKFVMDSWAFSQVVFDRVLWAPNDGVNVIFGKVVRRKPSCLDIAFSVLGNDQTVPDLVARMADTNGVRFRDGLPYQHNLTAVRRVIDSQDAGIWTNNIYTGWLAALRALSAPTSDPKYPEAMRTRAWAMKTLNTQLASWTELRHDTVLYAKQAYTPPIMCSYPCGFVEPVPEFWQRMKTLADGAAATISALGLSGSVLAWSRVGANGPGWVSYDLGTVQSNQVAFLHDFSAQMAVLRGIADKELARQPLSTTETNFLVNLVERKVNYVGVRNYSGWYPRLFYRNVFSEAGTKFDTDQGSDMWDAMVSDVHTDVPDDYVGDPGAVIHEGIGNVHLLLIAVDNGPDRMVYAGPVFSHYEFEVPGVARLSDDDWKARLQAGQKPPSPEWTRSYLVPSP